MLNVGSLFSGVGGFDLGLERAGMRVVWQCEADPYRRSVLRRHWPRVPCYDDVRGVGLRPRPPLRLAREGRCEAPAGTQALCGKRVDLLCGGFPCQDLSVAGRRRGLAGERSGLFFEFARVAGELVRPRGWVLVENVPGLLSSHGGRDFAVVVRTLGDLGFHDLAWRVLDSRYFGVPQRRRRVYVLGRRAGGRLSSQVLLEPESGGGNPQTGRDSWTDAAGTVGGGAHGAGRRTEDDDNYVIPYNVHAAESCATQRHAYETDYARSLNQTGGFASSQGGTVIGAPAHANGVRTAPEFPGRVDDPRPDGPRYAAMGDAVTVNVAEWIGRRLVNALEQLNDRRP